LVKKRMYWVGSVVRTTKAAPLSRKEAVGGTLKI